MEKWKIKGKRSAKSESVLPPTRRVASPVCLPMDKKRDGKWSFGGFLRRISAGQNNDVSSNDDDITYIPGHLLSKRKTKKTSKMKSKVGRIPVRSPAERNTRQNEKARTTNDETPELTRSVRANTDRSEDCLSGPQEDSLNSRSSEGSLDASGKSTTRIERVKARAKAKRDRLCGNSSSDDDSHRSSQSSMRFRSEDNIESVPAARRTRAARTERYMNRIFRDDAAICNAAKSIECVPLPTTGNLTRCSANSVDSNIRCSNPPKSISSLGGSTPSVVDSRCVSSRIERHLPSKSQFDSFDARYLRDMNENETFERQKQTWPGSRRATPIDEIYGSLKSTRETSRSSQRKLLPPEPPPRSSRSRIFPGLYGTVPSNDSQQSCGVYFSPGAATRPRYSSDNELVTSDYAGPTRLQFILQNCDAPEVRGRRDNFCRYDNCGSLDRRRIPSIGNSPSRRKEEYRGERENYDPRVYFENASPPPSKTDRATYSLPKGLELFSRQRLSRRGEECLAGPDKLQDFQTTTGPSEARDNCQSPSVRPTETDEDARRKRSSKNLEEALSELEAIYNSLRLSDDDLLERAEQRSMEEYRDRAVKSALDGSFRSCSETSSNERDENPPGAVSSRRVSDPRIGDDMAYRRMNPKERPSSVNGQSALSTISYLASSPNLSGRDNDFFDNGRPRSRRGTPDPTRDDLLYRSITHANSTLRVIEPQPPFGIPLGPVTTATESDYLHVRPSKLAQTRSLYIPKSEPDVVSDDLAFRNLRKDPSKDSHTNKNNLFVNSDMFVDKTTNNRPTSGSTKKRSVRSMSADLYGIMRNDTERRNNDWYNDYIRSTQRLRFADDNADSSRAVGKEDRESYGNINVKSEIPANSTVVEEPSMLDYSGNNAGLDINGNRPRSGLRKKIQVYVPQGTSIDEAMAKQRSSESRRMSNSVSPKPRDSVSDDEEPKPIESFTEQELSEYKQLCKDLEKLIERTDEQEDDAEVARLTGHAVENNSQSEFDELEKLLSDDYELPVVASGFDETNETASTERDDDRSSSRSGALGPESFSSDCARSSTIENRYKFVDDDGSSTSDRGNASSNTASSLTDSVYDKFNRLLREVNDVPFVQPKSAIERYRADELDTERQIFNDEEIDEGKSESALDGNSTNFNDYESASRVGRDTLDVPRTIVPSVSSDENLAVPCPDESLRKPIARLAVVGKRETCLTDRDEISRSREGERIEAESACHERVCYASNDINTTMHTVRKLCHVTNSITAYHIVMCSFLLTLLITIIVAQ